MNVKSIKQAARELLQTMAPAVLAAAARGDLDLNALAREQLAAQGLDLQGEWIGFPAAARMHKAAPLKKHAAALRAVADDAMIGAGMGTLAEADALLYQAAADALSADSADALRRCLSRADTAQRDRVLEFVHPLHWADLGCKPISLERSLAEYMKKFGGAA